MGSSRVSVAPSQSARDRHAESLLGFPFRDPSLFRRALTHRSFCNEEDLDSTESYERLEFLGDAVLELIISGHLYRQFSSAQEGQLTKSRVSLVRRETLASVARRLRLGEYLRVGHGVEASGDRYQDKVLADVFEAVVAAVYLDRGLEAACDFVGRHMAPELEEIAHSGSPPENPKSSLQELLQGQGSPPPSYRLIGRKGPDHSPIFTVEAVVGEKEIGTGKGGNKAEAEKAAAQDALTRLKGAPPESELPEKCG